MLLLRAKKYIGPNRLKLDLTVSPCSKEKTCSRRYFAYLQTKHFNWPEADITNSTRHLNCIYARPCAVRRGEIFKIMNSISFQVKFHVFIYRYYGTMVKNSTVKPMNRKIIFDL